MDIDQASNFLIGTILIGLGLCVITVAIVFINNIISKFWKPVNFGYFFPKSMVDQQPTRFATQEELQKVEPSVDNIPVTTAQK